MNNLIKEKILSVMREKFEQDVKFSVEYGLSLNEIKEWILDKFRNEDNGGIFSHIGESTLADIYDKENENWDNLTEEEQEILDEKWDKILQDKVDKWIVERAKQAVRNRKIFVQEEIKQILFQMEQELDKINIFNEREFNDCELKIVSKVDFNPESRNDYYNLGYDEFGFESHNSKYELKIKDDRYLDEIFQWEDFEELVGNNNQRKKWQGDNNG